MTSSPTPIAEVRLELKRPKVSFSLDRSMAKETDPLPIVELKPFIHKVWRREKSLPLFYDKSDGSGTGNKSAKESPDASTGAHDNSTTVATTTSTVTNAPSTTTESPPPSQVVSLPSPRLVHFYVNTFNDFKSQKEHFHSLVGESLFRSKSRIHPLTEAKQKKQQQHQESLIPGFITREDRTKTTLMEISDGDSTSRSHSCLTKVLAPGDVKKQQEIRVTGAKLNQNIERQQLKYLRATKSLYMNTGWHGNGVRHNSPASSMYHSDGRPRVDKHNKRVKTPLYDHLDRNGTLPSLTINPESLRNREPKPVDDRHSDDYRDYRDAYEAKKKEHKVGGIKNSLKVLSKHGTPTKVERQLSFELEINLSRFRKSRDYFPFEISPSEMAKYYPSPVHSLTQGEALLRKGMQSNASRRRRFLNSRGTASTSMKSTASVELSLTPGTMRKHFENDHSMEGEITDDFQSTSRTDKVISTAREEDDPMDTPRSPVNSIGDAKHAQPIVVASADMGTGVKGQGQGEPMCEGHGSPTISSSVSIDSKTDSSKVLDAVNNGVPGRGQLLAGHTAGPDGRTFIKTDSVATVRVTG